MNNKKNLDNVKKEKVPEKWIGLPSSRFRKYRGWINKVKPGICGTYSSAVLLHDAVYQKTKISLRRNSLLNGMQTVIDDFMPYKGTFIWDLVYGLKKMLKDIPFWKIKTGIISERIVPQILGGSHPVPIVVGTTILFNSSYKNHWLLVYAYGYNEEGKLYFKAYDNHGKYDAIIPASQTLNCIWLEKRG